jgi:hypothetical protein
MEIISRQKALSLGLKLFYTGKPCKHGHDSPRYVNSWKCQACNLAKNKEYQKKNKELIAAQRREKARLYPDLVKAQKRRDYLRHYDKRRAAINAWNTANCEKMSAYRRQWLIDNADRFRAAKTAYYLKRKRQDPGFDILTRLRRRINHFVSGNNKSASTEALIGCSYDAFAKHIESQFADGMTWENRCEWHIDHIIPCAAFDLNDPEQQRQCFHYTNMRPLWAHENRRKGASMPDAA